MTRILSFIGYLIISLLARTLRIRALNVPAEQGVNGPLIYAFWHGEQFIPFFHHRDQSVAIMSSLSRDGEIQAGILDRFGYCPVRGSSTRGGNRALVATLRLVRAGHSAAFAVDGPRGPLKELKSGIVYLAQKTGRPLIPVSASARSRKVLSRAWDRYQIPLPFSPAVIVYGKPISVGEHDDLDAKRREAQEALERLSGFATTGAWSKDIGKYLHSHPRPKILVVQPSRIGDVIFTLPAVAALRKAYPHAWIGWFVDERCAALVEGNPDIDEVIVFDRGKRSLPYLLRMYRTLHARKIDLSIDFHGLFKSAFMVGLAGARFRIASSSTNGMRELSWIFSREIRPEREEAHCVERHLSVARFLGCPEEEPRYPIRTSETERRKIAELFRRETIDPGRPVVALHPGGGWTSRRWPFERFAALADRLSAELGAQVLLVGGREGGAHEKGLNEEILARVSGRVTDLTGALNLKELAALFESVNVFVANEAGPMHMATALKTPAVAILGPTDPARTGPFGGRTAILRHIVTCQPCRQRSCGKRLCIDAVTVDEVFAAVKEKLAAGRQ